MIAGLVVVCGAEGFTALEEFGQARKSWLKKFLELPGGSPRPETFGRVFARLNPTTVEPGFARWRTGVLPPCNGEVVAVAGKPLRRSAATATSQEPRTIGGAWASAQRLTLGQVTGGAGTNELNAIPALFDALELAGCLVSVAALNRQKEIAAQLRAKNAD